MCVCVCVLCLDVCVCVCVCVLCCVCNEHKYDDIFVHLLRFIVPVMESRRQMSRSVGVKRPRRKLER